MGTDLTRIGERAHKQPNLVFVIALTILPTKFKHSLWALSKHKKYVLGALVHPTKGFENEFHWYILMKQIIPHRPHGRLFGSQRQVKQVFIDANLAVELCACS